MNELDDKQCANEGLRELALFAGAGGGILAGKLLGWRTVCAVEREPYAASVLAARQNDGILEAFPIWDDVCTFDGKPWNGIVGVVSGGFPCQDLSAAGKGAGLDGARSGLWSEMARIVREVRPEFVYVENSPRLVDNGLDIVLRDLAEMGFDAEWGVLSAGDTGAPHVRERVWILAHNDSQRLQASRQGRDGNDASKGKRTNSPEYLYSASLSGGSKIKYAWPCEPGMGRVADGMAFRVDRLKALGNGQVPRVAATAFDILSK